MRWGGPLLVAGGLVALALLASRINGPRPWEGRWTAWDAEGRVAARITVGRDGALRDHAPGRAKVTAAGNELRLSWPDGFRDLIRAEPDGGFVLAALPRWTEDWGAEPRFVLVAERR